ncbi:MAG: hypothetical protein PHQ27_09620, partial [Victivallales bacterium]|nr:hypothetical protein [Victivallales bacterium]
SGNDRRMAKETVADKTVKLPFTNSEAEVLIGYNFKITMNETTMAIVRDHPELAPPGLACSWGGRTAFYHAIGDMGFADYVRRFVVGYYSAKERRQLTVDELNSRSGMKAIASYLATAPNIRVIHTANDFLERPEDHVWLRKTMGERCFYYRVGGHLGELYFKIVQERLTRIAAELQPTVPPAAPTP